MAKNRIKYNNVDVHIKNLKELRAEYVKKDDIAAVVVIDRAIEKWERIRLGEMKKMSFSVLSIAFIVFLFIVSILCFVKKLHDTGLMYMIFTIASCLLFYWVLNT